MPDRDNNGELEEKRELQPHHMFKCFYLLVGKLLVEQIRAGSQDPRVAIKRPALEQVPDRFELHITFDEQTDSWQFRVPYKQLGIAPMPKRRKRPIITPPRRLIIPGGN